MSETANELLRWLAAEFSTGLAQILESMTDQQPKVASRAAEAPSPAEETHWWEQPLNLADAPLIFVAAPAAAVQDLGSRTLRAAGIDAVEAADATNTYLEILNQALSGLAQAIGGRLGAEVACAKGSEGAGTPGGAEWAAVEVAYPDAALPPILVGFAVELIARLHSRPEADAGSSAANLPAGALTAVAASAAASQNSKTFDLLLDVELPVSVSFGRAELPLKDVLKLTTGSIVELNRAIAEPVEVIVNNCVVARGEVVVMDGNYGVRIHQIISPQERLRTLK